MKEKYLGIAIVIGLLIFLNSKVDTQDKNIEQITGKIVYSEKIVNNNENLEIQKNELKECFSFVNSNGELKSCFALERFSCDYCNNFC
ncbi:MAG: hypothetical protein KKF65_00995 [Nanoarchaeota archaeon]|nr:hypothetical protein [Nanoarchaeota archaeon]